MDDQHDADCGCQEYNELSRRQFLAASAGISAAAVFPAWLPKIVMSKNYSSTRDVIVSVFQRGG
ncbi:MAG TPA: twin-arginine translocation signal domain-containing protein, partial [Rudaea sp.]